MNTEQSERPAPEAPRPPTPPPAQGPGAPPPPAPEAPQEEQLLPSSVEIRCPLCQTHWANAAISFGKEILPSDFTPREDLSKRVAFQKNGLPICPVCNFKYDEQAMYSLLIAAANKEAMERKAWGWAKGK